MGKAEGAASKQFIVKTPGKLIISGEHAVVYGRLALAASVDLLTEIHVTVYESKSLPSSVRLEDLDFTWNITECPSLNGPHQCPSEMDNASLEQLRSTVSQEITSEISPQVQMSLMALYYLYSSIIGRPAAFTMRIKSAIPIGAGMGSSAAFSVASSAAFHLIHHYLSSDDEFTPNLELINSFAFQCEKIFHATPSGIDNAVCTFGGVVKFQKKLVDFVAVPEARILLVDTRLSRQTKFMVESVRRKRERFPNVVEPILDAIDQVSHQLVEIVQQPPDTSYGEIQDLLSTNHWLLASLGVSCSALNDIHHLARTHVQAGKLTGAGGGGLAFIWLDPACKEEQLCALRSELENRSYVCDQTRIGVPGLQIESS